MRRLSLTNLETLCWIARLGSFTAAAQRLNTTQPAISGRIRELEQSLGVQLFRRQGRKMELTILGRELVERSQPLIDRLEDVVISLDNPHAATGIIRIGVGEMVAVTWFGDLMARLQRLMPQVTYQIEVDLTVNMRQMLELGQLDVAIVAARLDSDRVVTTPLGGVDVLWVMAPSLGEAAREQRLDVAGILSAHPVWCLTRPSRMHPMAVDTLRRFGVAQTRISTSNSLQSIVQMVAQGAGIALLPENLVAARLAAGELVPLSAELAPERLEFVVARHRDQDQAIIGRIIDLTVEASAFLLPKAPAPAPVVEPSASSPAAARPRRRRTPRPGATSRKPA